MGKIYLYGCRAMLWHLSMLLRESMAILPAHARSLASREYQQKTVSQHAEIGVASKQRPN